MPELLIELFSEEIPARMQARAREDLKKRMTDGLVEAGLIYESAGAFSTPRRLALVVQGLSAHSAALREERKGPRTDAPPAALEGFLRSTGLRQDQLEVRTDKKAQVYFAVVEKPARNAAAIVAEVLADVIVNFPWPKSMRWGSGTMRWVRPLHSILCLLSDEAGAEIVPFDIGGIKAGNQTHGHRFMAPDALAVQNFEDYRTRLRRAYVMPDSGEREAHIWHEAQNQAFARGLEVMPDPALLAEVAGLVEWPVVLLGQIDTAFLGLPPEVLQTSMREHQKFFALKNPKTGLIEGFVTVANRETRDQGVTILKGNQKVLAARLSDARFFWENDLRYAQGQMADWAQGLAQVTFHNKLGTQAGRVARIAALAGAIAPYVGAAPEAAMQAARLAKCDLRSEMVGEFPELQGVMGRYYAQAAGVDAPVCDAVRDHYAPLGPSDHVPDAPVSVAVALADKIDILCGFWAIDEKPTGSKDPFALRRAALGIIRLLLENKARLPLLAILAQGTQGVAAQLGAELPHAQLHQELLGFLHDRLKVFLRDQGLRHDVIDACLAVHGHDDITLLVARARALADFLQSDDGVNLVQGFKRANNILTQAEAKDGVEYSFGADVKFAESDAERTLFAALERADGQIKSALSGEDFTAAMAEMARLRPAIDAFFTEVQVNSDNGPVRRNRLNLLHQLRALLASIADLGRIEG